MFNAIFRLVFTSVTGGFALNPAKNHESSAHSSTGKRSGGSPRKPSLPQIDSFKFHNLFHSPMGVLFHLSLTVLFTISDSRVFSLTRWSSLIHKGFLVSQATREIFCFLKKEKKRDFHPLWCRFQLLQIFLFYGFQPKGSAKRLSFVFPQPCFSV